MNSCKKCIKKASLNRQRAVRTLLTSQRVCASMRVMLFAATGALRCSSLRLSALRTTTARRSVALHATTSAARQARRAAALNDASNPYAGKTVADLKELLRARGLPVSGVKATLLERLENSDGGGGEFDDLPVEGTKYYCGDFLCGTRGVF